MRIFTKLVVALARPRYLAKKDFNFHVPTTGLSSANPPVGTNKSAKAVATASPFTECQSIFIEPPMLLTSERTLAAAVTRPQPGIIMVKSSG